MAAILAAGAAPYVATTSGVLMPVKVIDTRMTATEVLARARKWVSVQELNRMEWDAYLRDAITLGIGMVSVQSGVLHRIAPAEFLTPPR